MSIALQLVKRNQFMEALDRFRNILQSKSDILADILIPLYKQLVIDNDNLHIRVMITDLLITAGQYEDALVEIEDSIEIDPNFSQAYFLLGKLHKKTPGDPEIRRLMEMAFEAGVKDQVILDTLPQLYRSEGNSEKSISFYTALSQTDPTNTTILNTLAELHIQARNYTKATELYESLSKLQPNLCGDLATKCESILKMCPMNITLRQTIVTFYFKACQTENAVNQIKELCRIDPSYKPQAITLLEEKLTTFIENSDIYLLLADLKIDVSSFSDAILYLKKLYKVKEEPHKNIVPTLQKILDRYPNQVIAHQFLVDIYMAEREFENCLVHIEALLAIEVDQSFDLETRIRRVKNADPEYIDRSKLMLAKLMYMEKRFDESILMCESLQDSELEIEATLLKAKMLHETDSETGYETLLSLIHSHPFSFPVHETLSECLQAKVSSQLETEDTVFEKGMLFFQQGDVLAAIEQFQNILPDQSHYYEAQSMVARGFLELGRFQMAVNICERIKPNLPGIEREWTNQIRFLEATSYFHQFKLAKSQTSFDQILQDDLQFPYASLLVKRLQIYPHRNVKGTSLGGILSPSGDIIPFALPNPEELPTTTLETVSFGHAHNEQAITLFMKQNYKGAHDELEIAYQMDPGLTSIISNLALIKIARDEYDKAIELITLAKQKSPAYPLTHLVEGLGFQKQGLYNEAIKAYHQVLHLSNKNFLVYLNLGDCFFELKNIERAHFYWAKAKEAGCYTYLTQRRTHYMTAATLPLGYWLSPSQTTFVQDL